MIQGSTNYQVKVGFELCQHWPPPTQPDCCDFEKVDISPTLHLPKGGGNYPADYQQEGLAWEFSQEGISLHKFQLLFTTATKVITELDVTFDFAGEDGGKEKVEDVENAGES